jgi:hypothetical protein
MTYRLTFLTALMVSVFPTVSHSAIITLNFMGDVTFIYNPHGIVGPPIALGAPVTASIRYDTVWPDLYPGDSTRGTYLSMPGWLKVNISGLLFEQTISYQSAVGHDLDRRGGSRPCRKRRRCGQRRCRCSITRSFTSVSRKPNRRSI